MIASHHSPPWHGKGGRWIPTTTTSSNDPQATKRPVKASKTRGECSSVDFIVPDPSDPEAYAFHSDDGGRGIPRSRRHGLRIREDLNRKGRRKDDGGRGHRACKRASSSFVDAAE
jgi:hypothetical protein